MALASVEAEVKMFELAQRRAQVYATSTLVPTAYQKNIGNVMIAMNIAQRVGMDVLLVMQNLHIIHGKPGWSSQFLIAAFNSVKNKYGSIRYRFVGNPGKQDYGCIAYTTDLASGEVIEGTKIDMAMARAEGWSTKAGSKWLTMPEQMLRYRAAAFLIRTIAPELSLGMLTVEEAQELPPDDYSLPATPKAPAKGMAGLRAKLLPKSDEPAVEPQEPAQELVVEPEDTQPTAQPEQATMFQEEPEDISQGFLRLLKMSKSKKGVLDIGKRLCIENPPHVELLGKLMEQVINELEG